MVCSFVIITVLINIEVIQSASKLKTNNFLCNRQQEMESVTLLREKLGKGSKKINKKDQDNTTALHYAVRYNHLHIVKLLLESGAGMPI